MSALAVLQRDFLQTLASGADGVSDALADGPGGLAPARGLAIYVHAYSARLREALANDHAALAGLLGDDAWAELCTAYIAAHPSRFASLRFFGDGLPGFLSTHEAYASTPLLAELAGFERALLDSFDAADAVPAAWDGLAAIPPSLWASLRPAFVPSLGRLATRHGAVEAWRALRQGTAPELAPARADWALWRDADLVTRFRSLAGDEAALLDHFLAGGDFAGGCELLQHWHDADAVPRTALAFLQGWCADGWIAAWRTTPV